MDDTLEKPVSSGAEGARPLAVNLSGKRTEQNSPLSSDSTRSMNGRLVLCESCASAGSYFYSFLLNFIRRTVKLHGQLL